MFDKIETEFFHIQGAPPKNFLLLYPLFQSEAVVLPSALWKERFAIVWGVK